jgi:hypothetical protein
VPKTPIYVVRFGEPGRDALAVALLPDGHVAAHHVSSSTEWSRIDMGLHPVSPKAKATDYERACPDGYTLVDLVNVPVQTIRETDLYPLARAALAGFEAEAPPAIQEVLR